MEDKIISYGGQAVIEGVMMRGQKAFAIAMRAPDGTIVVHKEDLHAFSLLVFESSRQACHSSTANSLNLLFLTYGVGNSQQFRPPARTPNPTGHARLVSDGARRRDCDLSTPLSWRCENAKGFYHPS